jgi:site-specific DNA-methyltransferase (adenine-specific)
MIEAMPEARQAALKWDNLVFDPRPFLTANAPDPFYVSALGALYGDDCMAVLPFVRASVVDTVFADPPFNLGKEYGTRSNDDLSDTDYLTCCKIWIGECARTLKPGGSFFLYNLPKVECPFRSLLVGSRIHLPALDCH